MEILLAVAPGAKPWDWRTLETDPLGGSETAAICLAESLAKLGHVVSLVGPQDAPDSPAGVHYFGLSNPNKPIEAEVVIVSRMVPWLKVIQGKIKLFWSHDMLASPDGPNLEDCDLVVALSRYHAQCFPGHHVFLLPNGIDPNLFTGIRAGDISTRQKGKLAWTSNWDRGLYPAIRIYQQLKTRYPLELHVYGGMDVYGWDKQREFLYRPQENIEGVVFHGSLNKQDLARELGTCWAWFYPTWWPETYCIAALEAQAAGTPCITVPVGALNETVISHPPSFAFERTLDTLSYDPSWEGASKKAQKHGLKQTWDASAKMLEEALVSMLEAAHA